MSNFSQCLGARAPLSVTPAGAFQFGGVERACALLISPAHVFAWTLAADAAAEEDVLHFINAHKEARGDFLLLGTGSRLIFPSPAFRAEIDRRGLGLEAMDTNAACRTYNVLVAEARQFTAALLPLAHFPAHA
jgi:uncharacterized protein